LELLCHQALLGIINIGVVSQHDLQALHAIRQASAHGHGSVKETATEYLQTIIRTKR
jgi:hypothetical protein